MAPPSVLDVLAFHTVDRRVYERFLSIGTHPQLARNAVALLIWLDRIGFDAVSHVCGRRSDLDMARIVIEVIAIVCCLRHEVGPSDDLVPIPLISSMCKKEVINIGFFRSQRDAMFHGVASIVDDIGTLIFHDNLYALLRQYRTGALKNIPPELARPYVPPVVQTPEDGRSMLFTFAKGFSFTGEEICAYFAERFRDCIEKVIMERASPNATIVFKKESFVALILNGEYVVKFSINGKELRARKYFPRTN